MIELSSVIRDLREELERAVAAAQDAQLRFEVGTVELEVSVALERTGHAGAKVRFWVVEAEANAAVGAASLQRITLALTPVLTASGTSPLVSGPSAPHER
jgi:NTP-dependent ternary system trypsin peptidase co-occuring protein